MRRSARGTASIPARALFADDMARNLAPAKAIGMTTLWVDNGSEQGAGRSPSRTMSTIGPADIAGWLGEVLGEKVA